MPRLPNSAIDTTPIGIGCAYLTAGSLTKKEHRLIAAAYDAGARHFDVAPMYGLGTAERVLGEALKGLSGKVTIATKVGIRRGNVSRSKLLARSLLGPVRGLVRRKKAAASPSGPKGRSPVDFSVGFVAQSLEQSLRELGVERIDCYLLHMAHREVVTDPLVKFLVDARAAGKVGALGLATEREDTAPILVDWPGVFDVVQYSWSALDPELVPSAAEPFRITHRALMRALDPMSSWLQADATRSARLNAACDADLTDGRVLSRALIGAALAENRGGITLVASRSIERTRNNIEMALDSATVTLGARLVAALANEAALPSVRL
ncbi:aldo/keto reductase [Ancylobacter sp. 6x-1]|uniref:Aldo/keto reductase n=1 Tax=Ancylobacter crimeensis TaxID=2579147 RepID=A0ABT0D6H9_9HYPH|nr:aldo/keto reductase [Ancylobacter crimeensis]MCK0195550.1 aldo/keto reductase [Ancylobacter crimeensis]